ncbi:MAG: P44/Msp2 family outer membrane protein [Desulfuromonadales bacterium]
MKTRWLIGAAILWGIWFAPQAMAETGYVYVGCRGGAGLLDSTEMDSILVDFDPGSVYAGAFGFRVEGGRVEAEIGYRESAVERIELKKKGNVYEPGGKFSTWSVMVNSIADFANKSPFAPYIFVGAGAARLAFDEDLGLGVDFDETEGWFFAYQGGGGIGWALSDSLRLDVEYRYFSVLNPEFKNTAGADIDFDFASHNALLGLRVFFW